MAEETIKLNLNEDVTSRLGLEPIKDTTGGYLFGGLVPVVFAGAHITSQTPEKGQFKDIECKVLNLEFVNFKFNANDPDRFLTHQEKVIGSVKKENDEYVPLDSKKVQDFVKNMWGRVKHIIDATKGLPNWKNIAEDKEFIKLIGALPVTQDAQKLATAYNALYTYIAAFFEGDGKTTQIYLTKTGKPLVAWLKILPEYNDGKWYTIPTYVGKGFIEAAKVNDKGELLPASIIKVNPSETLELSGNKKAAAQAANQGMPGITPGAVPGNIASALGLGGQ